MVKKIISFFKCHKASHAIEAVIMTPIWIAIILYCLYTQIISSARQALADESIAISNIVALSKSSDEAFKNIENYITVNNLSSKFDSSSTVLYYKNDSGNYTRISNNQNFKNGDLVYVSLTIKTAFTGINFNTMNIGGTEFELFDSSYTNKFLVVIRGV